MDAFVARSTSASTGLCCGRKEHAEYDVQQHYHPMFDVSVCSSLVSTLTSRRVRNIASGENPPPPPPSDQSPRTQTKARIIRQGKLFLLGPSTSNEETRQDLLRKKPTSFWLEISGHDHKNPKSVPLAPFSSRWFHSMPSNQVVQNAPRMKCSTCVVPTARSTTWLVCAHISQETNTK